MKKNINLYLPEKASHNLFPEKKKKLPVWAIRCFYIVTICCLCATIYLIGPFNHQNGPFKASQPITAPQNEGINEEPYTVEATESKATDDSNLTGNSDFVAPPSNTSAGGSREELNIQSDAAHFQSESTFISPDSDGNSFTSDYTSESAKSSETTNADSPEIDDNASNSAGPSKSVENSETTSFNSPESNDNASNSANHSESVKSSEMTIVESVPKDVAQNETAKSSEKQQSTWFNYFMKYWFGLDLFTPSMKPYFTYPQSGITDRYDFLHSFAAQPLRAAYAIPQIYFEHVNTTPELKTMHETRTFPFVIDSSLLAKPKETPFSVIFKKFQVKGFKPDCHSWGQILSSIVASNDMKTAPPPLLFLTNNTLALKELGLKFTVTDNDGNICMYKAIALRKSIDKLLTRDLYENEWTSSIMITTRTFRTELFTLGSFEEAVFSLYTIGFKEITRDQMIECIQNYPKTISL